MHITKLTCGNFRSYDKDASFSFRKGFNAVVGENNAGKTNLLRVFELIFDRLKFHTRIVGTVHDILDDGTTIQISPTTFEQIISKDYFTEDTQLELLIHSRSSINL
jgi:AAA15 family ATPase/GTPase